MYSRWQLAKRYIHYYYSASNGKGHGVHSPFVFEFILKVLNDGKRYEAYDRVEALRRQLLLDERVLDVADFGAGSVTGATRRRSVASITKNAAKSRKYAQLLYRITAFYKPSSILELGTSLGISTAYMSLGNPGAAVITAEGSEAIAAEAVHNFQVLGLPATQLVQGNFDDTLPAILGERPQIDLAFIDGNHRLEPTLRYFHQLLPHLHEYSILIFDDIHWSEEMETAWQAVKDHEQVTLSIDLFFIGLVFFRKDFKVKQHFAVRY